MEMLREQKWFSPTTVLFFAVCAVYIYSHVFLWPDLPIFYENDHTALLNDAKRMFDGEVIYKDFFEFTFPGAASIYYLLFQVFGPRFWVLDLVIFLCGLASALTCYAISKRLLGNTVYALLPPALFVFFGFRWFGLDGEHRSISPIFVSLAIVPLLDRTTALRAAAAGALCAFASFFTQQRGLAALAAIGLYMLIDLGIRRRELKKFVACSASAISGFVVTLSVLLAPFIWKAGDNVFFASTIGFLRSYVKDPTTNSLATYFLTFQKILSLGVVNAMVAAFYYLLIPGIFIGILIYLYVKRRSLKVGESSKLLLISLLGLFLMLGTPAPNAERLFQICIPALVLAGWLVSKIRIFTPVVVRACILLLIAVGCVLAVRVQTAWTTHTLTTPAGEMVFLTPEVYERYKWLSDNIRPGDEVYETYNAQVNFPLGVKNPSKISVLLNSGYNPPSQVAQAISDIDIKKPRFILWDAVWTREIETQQPGDRLEPFYRYLTEHYELRQRFTPYDGREREVWERKAEQR